MLKKNTYLIILIIVGAFIVPFICDVIGWKFWSLFSIWCGAVWFLLTFISNVKKKNIMFDKMNQRMNTHHKNMNFSEEKTKSYRGRENSIVKECMELFDFDMNEN